MLKRTVTITEYIEANGFKIKQGKPHKHQDQAERIFKLYKENHTEKFSDFVNYFRLLRNSKQNINPNELPEKIKATLVSFEYDVPENGLSKYDCKYLSGDWLEEWVYYRVKQELGLANEQILTGTVITKGETPNEMDVMFVYDHQLYVVECKTSVFEDKEQADGSLKQMNILGETIYKSDALRSKLGLFAQSSILTLSELLDDSNMPLQRFKTHFDRASLSRINLISRRKLMNSVSFKVLLGINHVDKSE